MSDDEFIDIAKLEHSGEEDNAIYSYGKKQNVRGHDISWAKIQSFSSSELYFSSSLYKVIKKDLVSARKRQFEYSLVQEYGCKFARKVGIIACPLKYRVLFLAHCQDVRLEIIEGNEEHIHQEVGHENKSTNYF